MIPHMELVEVINGAKNLGRTGWSQRGVPAALAETVSQHSFEAAILAHFISSKLASKGVTVNPDRAATIALFHDLAESLVGDLPRWSSDRVADKENMEREAFKEIGYGVEIFDEYAEGITLEAKVAKLADMLSTVIQSLRYESMGFKVSSIRASYWGKVQEMLKTHPFNSVKAEVDEILKPYKLNLE